MAPRAPAVSVLIPTFNRLDYLPQTLASVYAQTSADFEVVLVDDGSTDGTREWISRQGFPRLRYVRTKANRGPAPARNLALEKARGAFIAFLDSDDLWAPDYLSAMLACFASPRTLVACSDMCTIDAAGRVIRRDFYRLNPKVREPRFERLSGLRCCPNPSTAVLRRGVFSQVGAFDEGFRRIHDDKDLFYRIAHRFGPAAFTFLARNLGYHRRHAVQITDWIERGVGYLPSRKALAGWKDLEAHHREMVLDIVYFSSKQDCSHCDALLRRRRREKKGRRSRTPAPATSK